MGICILRSSARSAAKSYVIRRTTIMPYAAVLHLDRREGENAGNLPRVMKDSPAVGMAFRRRAGHAISTPLIRRSRLASVSFCNLEVSSQGFRN